MKFKKLFSLILVAAMMLSIFAMTASAEEVDPRANSMCPNCGYSGFLGTQYWKLARTESHSTGCGHMDGGHSHYIYRLYWDYDCDRCGYTLRESTNRFKELCVDGFLMREWSN